MKCWHIKPEIVFTVNSLRCSIILVLNVLPEIKYVHRLLLQKPKPKISASRRLFLKVFYEHRCMSWLSHTVKKLLPEFMCKPHNVWLTEVPFFMWQTKLLKKAMAMLDSETQTKKVERERILAERCPSLQMSGLSLQDLQVQYVYNWNIFLLDFIFSARCRAQTYRKSSNRDTAPPQ